MKARVIPSTDAVRDALARLRERLAVRFRERLREVVLFGSQARGDATEDSDVDVLVVIDDLSLDERLEVFRIAYDIDAAGPWVGLSPLAYSTEQARDMRRRERLLFRDIDSEGIPL